MAKLPYIAFYTGDYVKDTRKLPLAARGAWMDLILFMWNEPVKGEISGTFEEFSRLLSCSIQDCEFAIGLLLENHVCDHEKLPNGRLKIVSRRMKRDVELSLKRSKSGKKGNEIKYRKNEKLAIAKTSQNTDNGIDNENDNEVSFGKSENLLAPQMVKIFQDHYPKYPADQFSDFPACLQIAYKIAKSKGWMKESVTNGKMPDTIKFWNEIVIFSKTDHWFSTRSISDFNKEYQRLIQKMSNGTHQRNDTEIKLTKQTVAATGDFGQL